MIMIMVNMIIMIMIYYVYNLVLQVLSIFPASSVQAVSVLVVVLRASLIGLRDSGVDIELQTEEKLEDIQALIQQLQERSREGSLRSDRDHLPLLSDQLDNEGHIL